MFNGKIFCIGLSKTGTSSLSSALQKLGYKSFHGSELLKYEIIQNITNKQPLLFNMVLNYDAFLDYPISLLFKHLDHIYSNSKFILTIRNPIDRYNSLVKHRHYARKLAKKRGLINPWGKTYKNDLETEISEYEKHYANVTTYFQDSNKLLILNICEGEGYEKLCPFLSCPEICEKLPKLNTQDNWNKPLFNQIETTKLYGCLIDGKWVDTPYHVVIDNVKNENIISEYLVQNDKSCQYPNTGL